jgi:hypothetical protein
MNIQNRYVTFMKNIMRMRIKLYLCKPFRRAGTRGGQDTFWTWGSIELQLDRGGCEGNWTGGSDWERFGSWVVQRGEFQK